MNRFRILLRDGFQCQSCGASPLRTPGTELHVDHILPWSSGGETVDSNLQSKCSRCNLGKNNALVPLLVPLAAVSCGFLRSFAVGRNRRNS